MVCQTLTVTNILPPKQCFRAKNITRNTGVLSENDRTHKKERDDDKDYINILLFGHMYEIK